LPLSPLIWSEVYLNLNQAQSSIQILLFYSLDEKGREQKESFNFSLDWMVNVQSLASSNNALFQVFYKRKKFVIPLSPFK